MHLEGKSYLSYLALGLNCYLLSTRDTIEGTTPITKELKQHILKWLTREELCKHTHCLLSLLERSN